MRPIPKRLLIHNVVLDRVLKKDRWGNAASNEELNVNFVRIEPSSKIIRDANKAEVQLSAVMFYDCKNSDPQNISFAVDDIIIFNGQKHAVKVVEPLYDGRKLHHYELGLIKHA